MCTGASSTRASSAALCGRGPVPSDGSTPTTSGATAAAPTLPCPGDEVCRPLPAEPAPELAQGEAGQPRGHRRARRRRSPDPEHRTQLTEVLAGTVAGKDLLASVSTLTDELDQPILDDVDEVGLVALPEQRLAGGKLDLGRGAALLGTRAQRDDLVRERNDPLVVGGDHHDPALVGDLAQQLEDSLD